MDSKEQKWKKLYLWGGIAGLLFVGGTILDIVLSMIPGWEPTTVPMDIQSWFSQLHLNTWLGFRNLDFLNMMLSTVGLISLLAVYISLKYELKDNSGHVFIALITGIGGAVLIIANNAALPMFELSQEYVGAETESQRLILESAGKALLSRGEHGSMGAFLGFFLSSAGTLLMSYSMLFSNRYKQFTAWAGIIGMTFLIIYTIGATFFQNVGASLIKIVAIPGGLLMIYWNIAIALELFSRYSENSE